MGRCRPFPDAAGCRWPRLNGKIDNILPNFSLFDSNETLNFKFVYNKWKSTRCKKTLNKQTKTQRNKVTEKTRFLQASKIHWTFQVCHHSPLPQWKSEWAGGGRLKNISNAAVKRLYMHRCNNYPWKPLSTIVTTANYPTRPAAVLSCNYHSSCTNAVAAATKRKFCFVSGLVFGWPVNMSVQLHAKSLPVFTNSTNK